MKKILTLPAILAHKGSKITMPVCIMNSLCQFLFMKYRQQTRHCRGRVNWKREQINLMWTKYINQIQLHFTFIIIYSIYYLWQTLVPLNRLLKQRVFKKKKKKKPNDSLNLHSFILTPLSVNGKTTTMADMHVFLDDFNWTINVWQSPQSARVPIYYMRLLIIEC